MKNLLFFLTILLFSNLSLAKENLYIKGGNKSLIAIALNDFQYQTEDKQKRSIIKKIKKLVRAQLNDTNIFKVHNYRRSKGSKFIRSEGIINLFRKQRILDYINVTISDYDKKHNLAELKIFDLDNSKLLSTTRFKYVKGKWWNLSAIISDVIYQHYTGIEGYINTKLIFVSESGRLKDRKKKISIMNLYGNDHRFLTKGKNLVLSPKLSNDLSKLVFITYKNKIPQLLLYNFRTRKLKRILKRFAGSLFAPRFSPDGQSIILSASYKGNSDISIYNIKTKKLKRLTHNYAIDTSPDISPDGKTVVFSSDRLGKQDLYLMNINGSNLKRVNIGSGSYATPVWSPDSKYIAFTRIKNNIFSIGVLNIKKLTSKILTSSYKDESPSWAKNSKFLIFTRREKATKTQKKDISKLYLINLNGKVVTKIKTPSDASEPYWSTSNNNNILTHTSYNNYEYFK